MFDPFGRIQGRRARRQQENGIVECALRDKNDTHSMLTGRWIHGEAQLTADCITLTKRFLPLGFRLRRPFSEPIEVQVEKISSASEPTLGWSFGGTIYEVQTPHGVIEWGLGPSTDHHWALNLVSPKHGQDE